MPNKHNAKCRHHIPKMKFSVRNWAEYDAALRARGSLTLWVTAEAMDHWAAQPRSTPGGQGFYSDLAIETSLKLRLVFRQPLRQTEGLMASIFDSAGAGPEGARSQHGESTRHALEVDLQDVRTARRACTHLDRQHRAEDLWCGRMVARKAWPEVTPWLEKAAPGGGCQYWVDRSLDTDRTGR